MAGPNIAELKKVDPTELVDYIVDYLYSDDFLEDTHLCGHDFEGKDMKHLVKTIIRMYIVNTYSQLP